MQRGFSLIELSIVLVILGLLAGGILAGKSLIRASELRATITEFQRVRTSAQAFRDKYFYLPGDMPNASGFWGAMDGSTGSTVACMTMPTTSGTATCNGDGNGKIDNSAASYEGDRFWQHLANAGMIEGTYIGVESPTAPYTGFFPTPGVNQMATKLSSAGYWMAAYLTASSSTNFQFAKPSGNSLYLFSGALNVTDSLPYRPEEAWNFDTKLDDGVPNTGMAISFKGRTQTPCTTIAATAPPDVNAQYNLSNTNRDCVLYLINVF